MTGPPLRRKEAAIFDIESNGASPSGETAGLITGKEGGKRLVAGLEPSAELLAIAMGAAHAAMSWE